MNVSELLADALGRVREQVPGVVSGLTADDLPFDVRAHGYARSTPDVGRVRVAGDLLAGYYDEVSSRTASFVAGLAPDDLDRVVDEAWDPPVTLGVRLVSVVDEVNAHLGQAQYVRGLLERR